MLYLCILWHTVVLVLMVFVSIYIILIVCITTRLDFTFLALDFFYLCVCMYSYVSIILIDIICCQRIVPTDKKAKQRLADDDVLMSDSPDEAMTESQVSDSEQWSLFEVLTPLAVKIIQDRVFQNSINIMYCLSIYFYLIVYTWASIHVLISRYGVGWFPHLK